MEPVAQRLFYKFVQTSVPLFTKPCHKCIASPDFSKPLLWSLSNPTTVDNGTVLQQCTRIWEWRRNHATIIIVDWMNLSDLPSLNRLFLGDFIWRPCNIPDCSLRNNKTWHIFSLLWSFHHRKTDRDAEDICGL